MATSDHADRDDALVERLLAQLERVAPRPLSIQELARRLELERYDHRALRRLLDAETAAHKLRRVGKTRYQWLRPIDLRPRRSADAGVITSAGTATSARGATSDRTRRTGRHTDADRAGARPSRRRDDHAAEPASDAGEHDAGTHGARTHDDDARPSRAVAAHRRRAGTIEGRYSRTRQGYGFVAPLGGAPRDRQSDVFIPAGSEGDALHGDVVEVRIERRSRGFARGGPPRTSGEVIGVVRRAVQVVIGTLSRGRAPSPWLDGVRRPGVRRERRERVWRLVPQNDLYPLFEIEGGIEPRDEDEGRLVAARFVRGPDERRGPVVAVDRILGDANDPEVQFLTVALEHGLRIEFPPDVVAEAEALPLDPASADVAAREDLRALPFVTIDGETARDFDDAVCLEPLPHGGQRLWVAIADVSHHVRPGSALDAEAVLRGTSVYFPDRAIPMLPERLSNELCSLKPDRERLVMVACMDLDRRGERVDARFLRGVIRSRARLTYTQVAAVLSDASTPQIAAWREELGALVEQLARMRTLMTTLLSRRLAAGSLDLDLPEALIDLSEEGRSIGVRLSQRNDAHRMIEEMMLEANQAVARFLEQREVPFPYRIHEPPNPNDVDALNAFLGPFGMNVDYEREVTPRDLQGVLRAVGAHPLSRVLSRQILRALMQARYSTENAGHFGLAFDTYCHFTSPIRRYPDLLVHRQLGLVLDGEAARAATQGARLEALSVSSSQREREAVAAERAMLDLKKAEFMLEHLLEPEPATIVGVAPFGFFVELEAYPIEGLVRAEDLPLQVTFDDAAQMLVARRSGERFRLGDRVLVEATDVSLQRRQVAFALLERLTRDEGERDGGRKAVRDDRQAKKPRKETRRADARAAQPARGRRPDRTRPRRDDAGAEKPPRKAGKKRPLKPKAKAKIGKRRKPSR